VAVQDASFGTRKLAQPLVLQYRAEAALLRRRIRRMALWRDVMLVVAVRESMV